MLNILLQSHIYYYLTKIIYTFEIKIGFQMKEKLKSKMIWK